MQERKGLTFVNTVPTAENARGQLRQFHGHQGQT